MKNIHVEHIKIKNALAMIVVLAAASILSGCGGGAGGGGVSPTGQPGYGRMAAELHFNSRAAGRSASQEASGTINITITISGDYSETGEPFPPKTVKIQLDAAGGHTTASLLEIPTGVNHLMVAEAAWPDGTTESIKYIIPEIKEGVITRGVADDRTTAIAETALALTVRNGVKLSKISQDQINTIADTVDRIHSAGYDYKSISPDNYVAFETNWTIVTDIDLSPASATVQIGATSNFTAIPKNAYNVPSTATVTWSVTGGIGSVSAAGLFSATAAGRGNVVAVSGAVSKSAEVTVPAPVVCGNAILETGETCDDGASNGQPNHCSASCKGTTGSVCGNLVVESGEACDDGNSATEVCAYGQNSCTVCNSVCQNAPGEISSCGDGATQTGAGETCDDAANNGQPNHCNSTCKGTTGSVCGNSVVEAGETCDDGNTATEVCEYGQNSCTVCNSTCQSTPGAAAFCGDGAIHAGNNETCDAGADNGRPNQCNETCNGATVPICGNGVVESGETCDDGNTSTEVCEYGQTSCAVCASTCQSAHGAAAFCGDGITQSDSESCDNGANNGQPNHCNDKCNGTTGSVCGNSVVEAGETCDDGNTATEVCEYGQTSCSVCASTCQSASGATAFCGDGATQTKDNETCDDGNTATEVCEYGQTSCSVCASTCQSATGSVSFCGDGTIQTFNNETCDDAANNGLPNHCNATCNGTTGSVCGNGLVEAGETCDDENTATEACVYGQTSCSVCNSTCQSTSGATAFCGDGAIQAGNSETCDDAANKGLPNHCNATCSGTTASVCGNGVVESGETCDDENTTTEACVYGETSCTVCDSTCQTTPGAASFCGDGAIQTSDSETCDDAGDNELPNHCNATCSGTTVPLCGNSVVEAGETCDEGNTVTEVCAYGQTSCSVCDSTCQSVPGAATFCGDGAIQTDSESCDDGANNGQPNFCNDKCNGTTGSVCGNNVVEAGENCDDGNTATESCAYGQTSCSVCNSFCSSAAGDVTGYCGEGTLQTGDGETCDDGADNGQPNQCNTSCNGTTPSVCGNTVVESGETCDDGNTATEACAYGQTSCAVCDTSCASVSGAVTGYCGDSVVQGGNGETCDDGNRDGGDGCAYECTVETLETNVWITIPPGDFVMGCSDSDGDCTDKEKPKHAVTLSKYTIEKYEVTNLQYAACVSAAACPAPSNFSSYTRAPYYNNDTYKNYPVVYVDWQHANSYCKWKGGRLPSEAEWEKAARGPSPNEPVYPWGNGVANCTLANYNDGTADCVGDTTEVGSYPSGASYYGIMDMAGNVWEWTGDRFSDTYYARNVLAWIDPKGPDSGDHYTLRGGSWLRIPDYMRTSNRGGYSPANTTFHVGFRCARDY